MHMFAEHKRAPENGLRQTETKQGRETPEEAKPNRGSVCVCACMRCVCVSLCVVGGELTASPLWQGPPFLSVSVYIIHVRTMERI